MLVPAGNFCKRSSQFRIPSRLTAPLLSARPLPQLLLLLQACVVRSWNIGLEAFERNELLASSLPWVVGRSSDADSGLNVSANVLEASVADDFFEGPEKTLMITFKASRVAPLRSLPDDAWSHVLNDMGVAILSHVSTASIGNSSKRYLPGCTAYLLSESSLFIYDNKIIFKTCGQSSPLRGLDSLLATARGPVTSHDDGIEAVYYARPSFFRPTEQLAPHRSFEEERDFLLTYFPAGEARRLGSEHRGVSMFAATFPETAADVAKWVVTEVYVTDLGDDATHTFSKKTGEAANKAFWSSLGDHERLDEYYFEPSGYSANTLLDGYYSTMHASPQKISSYVSLATNAPTDDVALQRIVERTVNLARGSRVTVYAFALGNGNDAEAMLPASHVVDVDGYQLDGASHARGQDWAAWMTTLTLETRPNDELRICNSECAFGNEADLETKPNDNSECSFAKARL